MTLVHVILVRNTQDVVQRFKEEGRWRITKTGKIWNRLVIRN